MVAMAAVAIACGGCAVLRHAAEPGSAPVKPVEAPLTPRTSSYLGVYEAEGPTSYSQVRVFAANVNRMPNIVLYYSGWGEPFRQQFAMEARENKAVVLVQINPVGVSLAQIAAGAYDTYLRQYADQVRTFAHPVIIGFAHEMNGGWYPWGLRRVPAATWIAAWRHVVTVFRQEGADNVTWLWTINRLGPGVGSPRNWWPGARFVTWVGIDGYYDTPRGRFGTVFAPAIKSVRKFTNRPILLSEVGISAQASAPTQIPLLFAAIREYRLLGLVWFDVPGRQDWRLEADPPALAAFRQALTRYK
jgi:hypothetical protein